MQNKPSKLHFVLLAALASIVAISYREYITLERLFSGNDFINGLMTVVTYQSECLRAGSLPLWNPFINFGYPWVEHYMSSFLMPTQMVLGYFTDFGFAMAQWGYLCWLALGGVGVYLCVIEMGHSARAAFLSAMAFVFSGPMLVITCWGNHIANASGMPFMIYGYMVAMRTGRTVSIISILSLAAMILSGYVASTVVGMYCFLAYLVAAAISSKKYLQTLKYIVFTFALGAALASPKLGPFAMSLKSSARTTDAPETVAVLGYISYYEFLSFLLPVKYYFSLYIGEAVLIATIYAGIKKRLKAGPFLWAALISAWLLMVDDTGSISMLHWAANKVLPFIRLMRLEFFYWYYPVLFLILYLSPHIDEFFETVVVTKPEIKDRARATAYYLIAATIVFPVFYNVDNYWRVWLFHAVIALVWLLVSLVGEKRAMQTALMIVLVAVEFVNVHHRVNINYKPVIDNDQIVLPIVHQNYVSHSYMDSKRATVADIADIHQQRDWKRMDESRKDPYLKPSAGNIIYRELDPISQKQFAGNWYNPQVKRDFSKLSNSPLYPLLKNQPIYGLYTPTGSPLGEATFDKITCSEFDFTANTPQAADFALFQMHDPRWRVYVDGADKGAPSKMYGYFMRVPLEPGRHTLRFVFVDRVFNACLMLSGLTIIGLTALAIKRRREA